MRATVTDRVGVEIDIRGVDADTTGMLVRDDTGVRRAVDAVDVLVIDVVQGLDALRGPDAPVRVHKGSSDECTG